MLADARLEPFFRGADRLGVRSAWWGHVPFAFWLIQAARPEVLVELGTYSGVSYSAFCQAVLTENLPCRCHAVDTWEGDGHAGHFTEAVFDDFKQFHDARYAKISTIHRGTFLEANAKFSDGSIDLLHIDGLHTFEAVRADFEAWLPKMSPRGVVLFHDAAERRLDFGVWRMWEQVCNRWPSFLFDHSHGLGVLAVGADCPPAIANLCSSGPERRALLQERFAILGTRWYGGGLWETQTGNSDREDPEAELYRLRAIETSTIWRATAPIRAVGERMARFRKPRS